MTGRREFYFSEYVRMIYAENIVNAYRGRAASKGEWAAWSNSNPRLAEILAEAEKLTNG